MPAEREIRAEYDRDTLLVYQAYSPAIAKPALAAQRFVTQQLGAEGGTGGDVGGAHLAHRLGGGAVATVLTDDQTDQARVHVQWDPERSLRGEKLPHRSIQVGLSRQVIRQFTDTWTRSIADVSELVARLRTLRKEGRWDYAKRLLPGERIYPVSDAIRRRLGM